MTRRTKREHSISGGRGLFWLLATLLCTPIVFPSAADDCVQAIVPGSLNIGGTGGTVECEVRGQPDCSWAATADADWIALGSTAGTAGDILPIIVAPLPKGVTQRSAIVTIDDEFVTLTQSLLPPRPTEELRLFGDVTFNARDDLRRYGTVAAGSQFTLAVTNDPGASIPDVGRVVGFGRSQFNQCILPVINQGFAQVSAGETHSMGLTNATGLGNAGTVVCWGDVSGGKCAVPADLGACRAISAGATFSMALTAAGTVRCWGFNTLGQCNVPGTNGTPAFPSGFVVAIAAGESHGMALISQAAGQPTAGVVHVWGSDQFGQVTREPAGLAGVVQIAAGANHCVALKADGSVVCWGRINEGQCVVPPGLVARQIDARSNYTLAVSGPSTITTWGAAPPAFSAGQQARLAADGIRLARAGADHVAVLTEQDRRLVLGGRNEYFQCNASLLVERVEGLACGRFSFAAWNDIGRFQVFCTAQGAGTYGVCSVPTNLERVHMMALGQEHAVAIERNTRRVAAWGDNSEQQCAVPAGLPPAELVSAGEAHSAVLTVGNPGTIHCWGRSNFGQCTVPALVGAAVQVACGRNHTMVIVHDGQGRASVRGWGTWGGAGQQTAPVSVLASLIDQPIGVGTEPVSIAGGGLHSMALLRDGSVVSWGIPGSGQLPTPSRVGTTRAIAAGGFHSVALTSNDRIDAWGNDAVHQVSGPAALAKVLRIAAGDNRTLVLVDESLPVSNDIDGDGCTNGADLGILLTAWGTDGTIPGSDPPLSADLNGDGVVNGADLGLLLEDWYANIDCGG